MTEDTCPCCGGVTEHGAATDSSTKRAIESSARGWRIDDPVLATELPDELRSALGRFLGTGSVDTLGEWAAAVRHHIDGDSITFEDLCVTDNETEHWGIVDGEKYHFACFYDAVILAVLVENPVDIRTKSPNGTVIEARAAGTADLSVNPDEAVFSFGIDTDVPPPLEGGPSLGRGYAAICPYVKAFPDRDAYERWAAAVRAATVGMPLAGATGLAAALVN